GKTIGVFMMQMGPGAENAFGGVAQAYADSVPVLLLPGGPPRSRAGADLAFESVENYRGITKWVSNINSAARIPEMMGRAYSLLKQGKPGPVMLEIPGDVGEEEIPDDAFDYTPIKPFKSGASPEDVRDLVSALLKSRCPVISAGQGVLYAEATDALIEFAEWTKTPIMTTLAGKSAFPETHPLSLGTGAASHSLMVAEYLKKTDFFFGIGTSMTSGFKSDVPAGAALAQCVVSHGGLNKEHRVDYGAVGDAGVVLRQMVEEAKRQLDGRPRDDERGDIEEIARLKAAWLAEWEPRFRSDEVPLSPYRVFREIAGVVDGRRTIITHDSGYPREQLAPFWETDTPRGYIGWGASTQLGYGLGLAIGAKIADPEKQVVNVMGDAAFGMAGLDVETAVRSEIPIITVILNNGVMTHYDHHMAYASERWGSNRLGGDYAAIGAGLGAYAEKVTTPDQIAPAIQRAVEANREGRPAVIETITKVEEHTSRY
ncbi:MAG: thiamine pyrophosphate-requiring protein, partial [Gemmatimonadetes bacterium]|nr:thiamine pyrophosphate-requiring protein [Gemmatimonadota bacterium]